MIENNEILRLLGRIDWDLMTAFHMVERLCLEAHMDDDEIATILEVHKSGHLEIITDTADEVLIKAQHLLTEARLAIAEFVEGMRCE